MLRSRSMERWGTRFPGKSQIGPLPWAADEEFVMKKLVFGLLAAATLGAALPAAAATVVHERPNGTVVVKHVKPAHHHRLHRVVWVDRHGHRHVAWR